MKHAGKETLTKIEPILKYLRQIPGTVERTPGCFYRGSSGFAHFHEDPAGIFADVKLNGKSFVRLRVSTKREQTQFLKAVKESLKERTFSSRR